MSFLLRLRQISLRKNRKAKIIWLGLDTAGKTTIIRRLTTGNFEARLPRTMGLNVDDFRFESDETLEIVSWDLGGQVYFRSSLWEAYMADTNGIIFVVDSADKKRFKEVKQELWKYVIGRNNLKNIPLLVLANKQDLSNAVDPGELATELNLIKIQRSSFMIMPVSALTGDNIKEALNWLTDRIIVQLKLQRD